MLFIFSFLSFLCFFLGLKGFYGLWDVPVPGSMLFVSCREGVCWVFFVSLLVLCQLNCKPAWQPQGKWTYMHKQVQHCVCMEQMEPSQGRGGPRGAAKLFSHHWYQNGDAHVVQMPLLSARAETGMQEIGFMCRAVSAYAHTGVGFSKVCALVWVKQREICLLLSEGSLSWGGSASPQQGLAPEDLWDPFQPKPFCYWMVLNYTCARHVCMKPSWDLWIEMCCDLDDDILTVTK